MKLLNMTEWSEVCKVHRPEHILEKPAAVGYWRSSISEHYWKLIPAHWGFREDTLSWKSGGRPVNQNGHMMMETTKFEELGGRYS